MWLRASKTNNDPKVIAGYYFKSIREIGGCPRVVRADRGTENTTIAFVQPFLRHYGTDSLAKTKSFWYGKSITNQRIESWWGQLRKRCMQWWMNFFKDMQLSAKFNDSNPLHRMCKDALRFCFMDLIDNELQIVKQEWNKHTIRLSRYTDTPQRFLMLCTFTHN
ncbi:uncharacterized protein LOC134191084 [Corticium candelabrum]|uniref:uncharacterized protein LOC134191084 n=1 Tax=Corticium candelabrum TaxID=121492 RepID=UPI002E267F4F|nr:uncharacterized protein LOC134191084 [Corticium candelabrum]